MKLLELLELYTRKRLRAASPNTIRLYRHSLSSFGRFLKREPVLDDLTDDNIEAHMWHLMRGGGSAASANKDRGQLICLWRFAAENRMVDTFPNVPQMKEPDRVPMGWMPWEIDSLLLAASREQIAVGGVPGGLWWSTLLRVLFDTAERIGAIMQLPRDACQNGFLLVPAESRKGRTRDRLYPLQPATVAAIAKLISNHDAKELFHFPYSGTYIYKRLDDILIRAGLPKDRKSKFHRIRKTVASAVARAGGDATRALDHASPKTTRKYLDPRIVGGVSVSDVLAAYLADPEMRKRQSESKKKDSA